MFKSGLPSQACLVLGHSLLWKVFEAVTEDANLYGVPASLSSHIIATYCDLGDCCNLQPDKNPIARYPLSVVGVDTQLIVDVIMTNEADDRDGDNFRVRDGLNKEEIHLLLFQVLRLCHKLADSQDKATWSDYSTRSSVTRINENVSYLAITPRKQTAVAEEEGTDDKSEFGRPSIAAILLPHPRTAYNLWKEYQFGGLGRKPAKDFAPEEHGHLKSKYCYCKILWDKVSELIKTGLLDQFACDYIYQA